MDDFFITKKKVKSIWTHFYTVISKPQSKAFRHTLNFINYTSNSELPLIANVVLSSA